MCGGNLSARRAKQMMGPKQFRIMPVPYVTMMPQMGGHCGGRCGQCGGDFLGIGKAFKRIGRSITSNPLRLAAAIGTMGMSETLLTPAQLVGDAVGVKPSKALGVAAPFIGAAFGPEAGMVSKGTSQVMGMLGQGRKRRKVRKKGKKGKKGKKSKK